MNAFETLEQIRSQLGLQGYDIQFRREGWVKKFRVRLRSGKHDHHRIEAYGDTAEEAAAELMAAVQVILNSQ